jgi:hypothetical protein
LSNRDQIGVVGTVVEEDSLAFEVVRNPTVWAAKAAIQRHFPGQLGDQGYTHLL